MGKRQIGDMQPFELVITLIIADLACIPMSDSTIPIIFGIVPLFTLVILHYVFTLLNRKSIFFRKILNGRPIIVIDSNGINYNALKKLNMTLNDLTEGLRANGCFNLADALYAIVETNGNISVLLKTNVQPVTNKALGINENSESGLNIILINDGKLLHENLQHIGLSNEFVATILKEEKISSISQVLIMCINENGEIYLQQKLKPYKIITKTLELNIK